MTISLTSDMKENATEQRGRFLILKIHFYYNYYMRREPGYETAVTISFIWGLDQRTGNLSGTTIL